jgi:hypothetical protein
MAGSDQRKGIVYISQELDLDDTMRPLDQFKAHWEDAYATPPPSLRTGHSPLPLRRPSSGAGTRAGRPHPRRPLTSRLLLGRGRPAGERRAGDRRGACPGASVA